MSGIRKAHSQTVAAVKSGVVTSLIEKYLEMNPEFCESLPKGRYGITLKSAGIRQFLSVRGGTTGVLLCFPKHADMIGVLSGEKGRILPLPNGTAFLSALKAFQSCAGAVAKAMDFVPEKQDAEGLNKKTPLLLTAALRGVCEVYNYDHWLKIKSSHIPAGKIGVSVSDNPEIGGVITVGKGQMSLDLHEDKEKVNAQLIFKTTELCYQVLTGATPAMGAVGDSRLMLKGRLPMIQGLFPLLDRFGELMR